MLSKFGSSSIYRGQIRSFFTCAPRFRRLDAWEEVELNRPQVPSLEGYERPQKAPKPQSLGEFRFKQYMNVKPPKLSGDAWVNIALLGTLGVIGCISYTTFKILRPDDFEWIEEERARMEAAKRKMNRLMEKKKREEEAAAALSSKDVSN